jgi:hypothetical protein
MGNNDNTGAVQTESFSSAYSVQNLGANDKKTTVDALISLKDHLVHLQDITETTGMSLLKLWFHVYS